MNKKWSLLIIVMVMMFVIKGFSSTTMIDSSATWIWNPYSLNSKGDEYIAFMQEQGVKKVFVQVDVEVPNETYRIFFEKAQAANIAVYALDGGRNWGEDSRPATIFMQWIEQFQQEAPLLTGIHIDVEPYLLEKWNTDRQQVLKNYFDVLGALGQFTTEQNLSFEVDMPFWFDTIQYDNAYGKGLVSEWVIDLADQVTLMAYRNQAEGGNGIIELVETELAYAQEKGKKAAIGVETLQSDEGTNISFYGMTKHVLKRETDKVMKAYTQNPAFDGIAVHYLDSWMNMK